MGHENIYYGIGELRIYRLLTDPRGGITTYGPAVVLPGSGSIEFSEDIKRTSGYGDGRVNKSVSVSREMTGKLMHNRLSFDALAAMNNGSVTTSSTKTTYSGKLGVLPKLKIVGRVQATDDPDGTSAIVFYKSDITSLSFGGGAESFLLEPSIDFAAYETNGSQLVWDVIDWADVVDLDELDS